MSKVGRKEEILAHARKLFSIKGYHGTTIRDISERSGILSGSLYAHIRSKEDLLFDITNRGADAFLESLTPIMEGKGSAIEKLRKALIAHIRVVANHLDAATVFFHEWKALSKDRRAIIQSKRDTYESMWNRLLEEGARQGELFCRDFKFVRLLILSAGNWLYQWYRPDGGLSPEEIAERFMEVILHGIAAEGGGNPDDRAG
jgi:TetR/AcrR family transcriptional regulator, cholesterol catabolism regulator